MAEVEKEVKDELIPVGPGADEDVRDESEERSEQEERAEGGGEAEDERVSHAEEDDDGEREQIRQRRRAEKQRKKENRNRDRVELNFLRSRNEQLERRQSELDARVANGEMVQIDSKIAELDGQIREANNLKALALSKNDGASVVQADDILRDLTAGKTHLENVKNTRINNARLARTQPNVDPMVQARAREWVEEHDWYDTNLRDPDSKVARAVEDQLVQEGRLDARNDEYWDELDRRLKKYLPHRFGKVNGSRDEEDDREEQEDEDREDTRQERRPRGPQVRVGGRERPLKKNEVYISAERKEAMMEAGVWNDPVLREKYLKQYQKFDRDNRRR